MSIPSRDNENLYPERVRPEELPVPSSEAPPSVSSLSSESAKSSILSESPVSSVSSAMSPSSLLSVSSSPSSLSSDEDETLSATNVSPVDEDETLSAVNASSVDEDKTLLATNVLPVDEDKTLSTANGSSVDEDKTLLATGALPVDEDKALSAANVSPVDEDATLVARDRAITEEVAAIAVAPSSSSSTRAGEERHVESVAPREQSGREDVSQQITGALPQISQPASEITENVSKEGEEGGEEAWDDEDTAPRLPVVAMTQQSALPDNPGTGAIDKPAGGAIDRPLQQYDPLNNPNLQSGYISQQTTQQWPNTMPPPHQWSQPAAPKQPGHLARPLPRWGLFGGLALLIVLFIVLHLTGSDWAAGAAHAAVAAFIVGIVLLIALAVRTGNGMSSSLNPTRRGQYITSILSIVVLFVYGGACQVLQPTLHIQQAHVLESQQQWQAAIDEYQQGGEHAPNSVNLARTYVSWGQSLSRSGQYVKAVSEFETVISQFSQVSDQVQLAQTGDINARLAVGKKDMQDKQYGLAVNEFDSLLTLSYCDAGCHTQASALDATSYYNVGESLLQTQDYAGTVTTFDQLLTKFPNAPEAHQLHGDMAKALLETAKSARSNSCSSALPIYQRLAQNFGDTSQGKTAQSDLNAPQNITGTFTSTDGNTYTQIGLTQGLKGGMSQDDLFNKWNNAIQKTTIQGNGNFTFNGVQQGDYDLFWYRSDGTFEYVEFIYSIGSSDPKYVVHVGQLCPANAGQVSNNGLLIPSIPTTITTTQ